MLALDIYIPWFIRSNGNSCEVKRSKSFSYLFKSRAITSVSCEKKAVPRPQDRPAAPENPVVIRQSPFTPVLGRCEHKRHLIVSGDAVLLPPVQLDHILTATFLHPVQQPQRHKPPQLVTKSLVQSSDRTVVQVVVVVVADEDRVYLGQFTDGARGTPEPLGTHALRRGGPGAKDRICEQDELIHFHHHCRVSQPRDS